MEEDDKKKNQHQHQPRRMSLIINGTSRSNNISLESQETLGSSSSLLLQKGDSLPTTTTTTTAAAAAVAVAKEQNSTMPDFAATSTTTNTTTTATATATATTTLLIIVLWHVLFVYQWNKRRKRKHLVVDYQSTVQTKKFHRLWITLLSHPPSDDVVLSSNRSEQQQQQQQQPSSRAIEMGNVDESSSSPSPAISGSSSSNNNNNNNVVQQQLIMSSTFCPQFMTTSTLWHCATDVSKYCVKWLRYSFRAVESSGALLLLYNSHIFWSCRALEQDEYGSLSSSSSSSSLSSSINYARILLCWGLSAFAMELSLSHYLVQRIASLRGGTASAAAAPLRQRRRRDDDNDSDESYDVVDRIHRKLLYRSMGSPTVVAATMLSVFQFQFPYVSLQILPFVDNPSFLSSSPSLCYLLCVSILAWLSRHCHFLCGVLFGGFVGLLWSVGWMNLWAKPYWNISFCGAFVVLSLLSLKATSYRWGPLLPCIDHVAWDRHGQVLVQDDNGRWVRQRDYNDEEVTSMISSDYEDGYYSSSSSSDDDDDSSAAAEDSPARAFPTSDDDEIYGHRLPEDDNNIEWNRRRTNNRTQSYDEERVPLRRQVSSLSSDFISSVRSRRGNTGQLR